jgi:hypothetical protein
VIEVMRRERKEESAKGKGVANSSRDEKDEERRMIRTEIAIERMGAVYLIVCTTFQSATS